jgi:hypothetical protein
MSRPGPERASKVKGGHAGPLDPAQQGGSTPGSSRIFPNSPGRRYDVQTVRRGIAARWRITHSLMVSLTAGSDLRRSLDERFVTNCAGHSPDAGPCLRLSLPVVHRSLAVQPWRQPAERRPTGAPHRSLPHTSPGVRGKRHTRRRCGDGRKSQGPAQCVVHRDVRSRAAELFNVGEQAITNTRTPGHSRRRSTSPLGPAHCG